jgi:group II intron reverse transcriptase/maturase
MMNGRGKSDSSAVPENPPNKAARAAAEAGEGRGLAKGNPPERNELRTQGREDVPSALERIRQAARRDRKQRFTALYHHVYDVDRLHKAYLALKRDAAAGVDGETWQHYGEGLEGNLRDLSERLKRGAYRAKPVRRAYIPKADGRQRPLGVPTLEDKIVQRSVVEVLNAFYETDFLGFSYGFRPGRGPHRALDALTVGIEWKKVNWVLDADIRSFFDTLEHGWLVKFIEHRIADRRVVRLIQQWLDAGVMLEGGERMRPQEGTVQGGSVSPLLANIYLHYVFDLWTQQWRTRHARGDVIVVRYADDFVVGFQYRWEAEEFQAELRNRFAKFGLELHPDKTRLIEFGRFAARNQKQRGTGKPETFDFLGFTHICGTSPKGRFTVLRQTIRSRMVRTAPILRERTGSPGPWRGRLRKGPPSATATSRAAVSLPCGPLRRTATRDPQHLDLRQAQPDLGPVPGWRARSRSWTPGPESGLRRAGGGGAGAQARRAVAALRRGRPALPPLLLDLERPPCRRRRLWGGGCRRGRS